MADFGIGSIGPNELQTKTQTGSKSAPTSGQVSFGQWLHQSLGKVNQLQQQAGTAALKLTTGENKDIHGTMIAMQKAGIATSLMIEVRNKLISAYDEIKRMQF
ncbi:MAG: flagellar hook-basal body complex protein FliE [Desulfobacteraceae bacterium]|jgi:flagellar hook-basal body complex protein FliE